MSAAIHNLRQRYSSVHHNWGLSQIVSELKDIRVTWRKSQGITQDSGWQELPSRETLRYIVTALLGVLFPRRLGSSNLSVETEDYYVGHMLDAALNALLQQVRLELNYSKKLHADQNEEVDAASTSLVQEFAAALPGIRRLLDTDVEAAYRGDPAAKSMDEVLLCYPGILAMIHYRMAHKFYLLGLPLIARIISEIAHAETGIDIHPGARIGKSFFIDHGTGVVIGETCIIGDRVRIYQAVTLGALNFPVNESGDIEKGLARHPIVEDDVVIYAGATILGRIVIGKGSTIGGNVWLTKGLPSNSVVNQARPFGAHISGTTGF